MVYIYLWCTKSYTCVGIAPIGTHTYKTHGNTVKPGGKAMYLVMQDKARNATTHTSNIAHSDCQPNHQHMYIQQVDVVSTYWFVHVS